MQEYTLTHADTCLPSYWQGHHLPHVCFPPWRNMTLENIKQALMSELAQDAIMGNYPNDEGVAEENFYIAARKAIENLAPNNPETKEFFTDIEDPEDETCESVMAYFVFMPKE